MLREQKSPELWKTHHHIGLVHQKWHKISYLSILKGIRDGVEMVVLTAS